MFPSTLNSEANLNKSVVLHIVFNSENTPNAAKDTPNEILILGWTRQYCFIYAYKIIRVQSYHYSSGR